MFAQEKAALERSEGGLGIGLALVKGLVELHGGTVEAHSAGAGRGSCFIVKIPRAVDAPEQSQEAAAPHARPSAPARRVLLADDNRDASDMLAELLRMDGHTVVTAHDGEEAAEMAMRLRPDVLVLDIGMPGLNGYEVARRVRAQPWGDKPLIVAATGWGQEQDRQKATERRLRPAPDEAVRPAGADGASSRTARADLRTPCKVAGCNPKTNPSTAARPG